MTLSDFEKIEAVRLFEAGNSQQFIADAIGRSQSTIGRFLKSNGLESPRRRARRSGHGSWKGGRVNIHGYSALLVDVNDPMRCMAHSTGYVLEHRLVMARFLGRSLGRHETVHHINGDKKDNRIENLQLRFGRHGKGVVMACRTCGSCDLEYREIS